MDIETIFEYVGIAIAAIFAVVTFLSGFFTVHTMQAGIVERFGKFLRIAEPGLNFKNPWFDRLVYTEDLSMQLMDVPVDSKTSDDATVTIPVRVQYYVLPDQVKDAYYKLDDPAKQIKAHVENVILSYIPKITLDETYQQEDKIAAMVKQSLTIVMEKFGYAIENALVTKVVPSAAVVNAMNDINAARREKVATEARAEGEKILKVKAAEAEAEAKALQGTGVARQRKAIIDGLKASVEDFQASVGVAPEEVMALVLLTQYFDALRDIGQNSNTILFPSSPGAVSDLFSQLRNVITTGTLAAEASNGGGGKTTVHK